MGKETTTLTIRLEAELDSFIRSYFKNANVGVNECVRIVKTINDAGVTFDVNKIAEYMAIIKILAATNIEMDPFTIKKMLAVQAQIKKRSAFEVKNKFTEKEWMFLADIMNGTLIDSTLRCNTEVLQACCEDAQIYEGTADKHGIDMVALIDKIKNLTGAQVDALYSHVENFWNKKIRNIISEDFSESK